MNATIRGFFKKEVAQVLRDKRMLMLILVAPVIQMTLFGLALTNENKNLKVAIMADDSDWQARRIYERCLASGYFIPARVQGNDPFEWVRSGQADVALVAPRGGLSKAIRRGTGRLQALIDASNVVKGQGIEQYVRAILQRLTSEMVRDFPNGSTTPIAIDTRVLFNPEMLASIFMVPSVLAMLLGVETIVLTAMAFVREKEMGTFEMLIASPAKPWEMLLGKSLPFVFFAMLDVPLVIGVAMLGFGVPLRGSVIVLVFSALVFVCTTVSIGILISTIAQRQQQAMMAGFLFLFPAMMLSGIMFPVENMPDILRVTAYLNPLKYFVSLLRNVMLKGGDVEIVVVNLGALILMALVAMGLAFKRFRQTLD